MPAPAYYNSIWLAALLLVAACREEKHADIIARVGTVELTRAEAYAHIDTSASSIDLQLQAYTTSWINSELLHQEAERQKIEGSDEAERKLSDARKQMVNQMFLDHYMKSDSGTIHEQELHNYYDAHEAEFIAHDLMLKLRIAVFTSRDRASAFTTGFMKTSNWDSVLAEPSIASGLVRSSLPQYYSQHTLFPPELWRIATTLSIDDISFPVKISSGYAIVQPIGAAREGKPLPFELVRDEIYQRLLIEHRRTRYDALLGTLRQRYAVEVFTGSFRQADTTHLQTHE
ncbi:MAG TPA: peptidylprolyl isomerase [Bacteroidota bacterium]|nr:peptidylprolyl isomerase [Bacteroidota bacterium]